ncbi:MAG TPA: prepilin-type N-terminal cleavage/methylation domain-containing protein, partial [Xanthomonadales bacterium]|nr:prepilin-type N-terminal cleavage/methylation domain-containing protein [Xanthomonadales bacterium]
MKTSTSMRRIQTDCSRGYTLVEVLIGIVIFAIGVLALTQLQGNLARSSGDSNSRTIAINLAEEIIEQDRTFIQVESGGGVHAFNDIVSGTETRERGGVNYNITRTVTDYYYDSDDGTFKDYKP